MARSKYTKLTWEYSNGRSIAVTPSGIKIERDTFGTGLAWKVTAIAWDGKGTPSANYWDQINGVRSAHRNLVEVEGSARALAERILYKKFPEWWLTPEEYVEWREYGVCEEDPWAISQGYL